MNKPISQFKQNSRRRAGVNTNSTEAITTLEAALEKDGWRQIARRKSAPAPGSGIEPVFFFNKRLNAETVFLICRKTPSAAALKRVLRGCGASGGTTAIAVLPTRKAAARESAKSRGAGPRFFASLEEIREAAAAPASRSSCDDAGGTSKKLLPKIRLFTARVLKNVKAGSACNRYCKLVLESPRMPPIEPFQFLMVAAGSAKNPLPRWGTSSSMPARKPFLNRPFGVHRVIYRDSAPAGPLPRQLATILKASPPQRFEILFKVIPDGLATPILADLKRDDTLRMLGPLGKPVDMCELLREGISEVHLIGGGAGMAPLVFLAQTLLQFAFKLKVFMGVAEARSLACLPHAAVASGMRSRRHLVVAELLEAGLSPRDLYVACEKGAVCEAERLGIPRSNFYAGVVTDQYAAFLKKQGRVRNRCMAFACGPTPMLKKTWAVARSAGVPLKVLLENRMACGTGVCLSCVCEMRDGSRRTVCTEGPVFDAGEIAWTRNNC